MAWLQSILAVDLVVQWLRIRFGCKRFRVQSPIPARGFMFDFLFCCCCVFTFLSKNTYLSQTFAIPFTKLIYLVYLTYCKICDSYKGIKIHPSIFKVTLLYLPFSTSLENRFKTFNCYYFNWETEHNDRENTFSVTSDCIFRGSINKELALLIPMIWSGRGRHTQARYQICTSLTVNTLICLD